MRKRQINRPIKPGENQVYVEGTAEQLRQRGEEIAKKQKEWRYLFCPTCTL